MSQHQTTANRLNHVQEYYFSRKLSEIRLEVLSGRDIINLGIGSPDMAPDKSVINEATSIAAGPESNKYQPYRSIPELRQAISSWYSRMYGTILNADTDVLPLIGSKEGIMHISMAYLNPGDGVLLPDPGYPAYEAVSKLVGARTIFYNLKKEGSWLPDFEELNSLDLFGVKLMWVNYPNMPTGTRPLEDTFRRLVEFGRANNILIVNDNPYSLIQNPDPKSILSCEGAKSCALELNSLSKSHNMAGWRIGMLAGSEENISNVLKVKSNMDSGIYLPIQKAAIKALELPDKWYADLNREYSQRKKIAYKMLDLLGSSYSKNQAGLFIWSCLPDNWNSSYEYSDFLLRETGVFVTPGSVFGTNGREYIRTSLCVPQNKLSEAMERVRLLAKNI